MSDLETLKAMLDRAGVPWEAIPEDRLHGPWENDPAADRVRKSAKCGLTVKNSPEGGGYGGFYGEWLFGADGELLGVSHWE